MKIFGTLHGVAFLAVTIVAAVVLRWKCWIALQAVLAAIPPLVSIPLAPVFHGDLRISGHK
ncbi:hypothetical protein M3C36_12850 [Dietzia cinnamea]|uniref:hypothetical protein n=1 Tax=Dietzia cinnamea TaxID=321318 RepID=UPI0021A8F593|nr:hypothetical protein [Dietzia cinnamea]MCT1886059.1 hypothetical protein [Dietzia cinnamea]